ncbi:MAG: nucleotidyltransferase domain-containing protein [Acidobacteria bacterium]|nr:nucleotidyltransferase domain-containing protein [Acidobacteriota bacterium]
METTTTCSPGLAALEGGLQQLLLGLRRRLAALYGDRLVKMLLYGSRARGDARSWSDVDILLVLRGPVRPAAEVARTENLLGEVSLRGDVVISCQYVSEEGFDAADSPLVRSARSEGIEV